MKEVKILDSLEMNKALQDGKRVRKVNWEPDEYIYMNEGKVCYGRDNLKKYVNEEWVVLQDLPLLDKEEKEYLKSVLKPFKGRKITIMKMDYDEEDEDEKEYVGNENIGILINGKGGIIFPDFKAGTKYKGLELWKEYTPEDLELF